MQCTHPLLLTAWQTGIYFRVDSRLLYLTLCTGQGHETHRLLHRWPRSTGCIWLIQGVDVKRSAEAPRTRIKRLADLASRRITDRRCIYISKMTRHGLSPKGITNVHRLAPHKTSFFPSLRSLQSSQIQCPLHHHLSYVYQRTCHPLHPVLRHLLWAPQVP